MSRFPQQNTKESIATLNSDRKQRTTNFLFGDTPYSFGPPAGVLHSTDRNHLSKTKSLRAESRSIVSI